MTGYGGGAPAPGRGAGEARQVRPRRTARREKVMHKPSAIPSNRFAQAFPTSWGFTVITAEPAATFGPGCPSRPCRTIHSTHRLGGLNSLGEMRVPTRSRDPPVG